MPSKKTIALLLLVPFVALTIYSVAQVGYIGLFEYHLHSPAGWQVFTDLVLALIIVFMWLIPDARRSGRNPWPWFAATVFLGSISPLLYLVTAKESDAPAA
ncbi:MAG: hypothetical protein AB8C02_01225 [Halioglobus sp.]